jgi:hypothetical protein
MRALGLPCNRLWASDEAFFYTTMTYLKKIKIHLKLGLNTFQCQISTLLLYFIISVEHLFWAISVPLLATFDSRFLIIENCIISEELVCPHNELAPSYYSCTVAS